MTSSAPTSVTAGAPETFTFNSHVYNTAIFVRKWNPPCGIRPRAAVQITHGIAEHSGRYDRLARFLAAEGCVAYALDLRGHGHTAGPDKLGQAGPTACHDMTADIKQLADIARDENPGLPLLAFGHSMGSALTQAHIENHGDLLAGAILCGTLGAIPGVDDDDYPGVIAQLQRWQPVLTPKHPASSSVACWRNSTPRSLPAWPTPPARSGRLATQRKSGCSRATRCAASHSPTR